MIDKHFRKMNSMVKRLGKSNRKNPYILSLLITESFFRNGLRLYIEILFWYFCSVFKPERVGFISIGIAQMQIRNWIKLGYFEDDKPKFDKVVVAFNPIKNYDVCESYIKSKNLVKPYSLVNIAKSYRGRVGVYYYNVLSYSFSTLTND